MSVGRRFIVGLELGTACGGALRFGAWIGRKSSVDTSVYPIHVVDDGWFGFLNDPGAGPDLSVRRQQAEVFLESAGVRGDLMNVELMAGAPERVLPGLALERDAAALIVGRAGETNAWTLASLGPVARRLLRGLRVPTAVVPPEYEPPDRPGPVVVATSADESGMAAARFADALARELGVAIVGVFAHTRPTRHPLGVIDHGYRVPADEGDPVRRLRRMLAEIGLGELPVRSDHGGAAAVVMRCADDVGASMIVCGSRPKGLAERLVTSSVGTDLAAHASCPVFVTPPAAPSSRPAW